MKAYEILGLMSGTSLDGLDIAHVRFEKTKDDVIKFTLINSKQYDIPKEILNQLLEINTVSATSIYLLDTEIGKHYANCINNFLQEFKIDRKDIDAIASHGQTIFHQPEKGYTVQIGNGEQIAAMTQIPVINDFRTKDIIFGGQGAPLVPIGDFDLFSDVAESFLNIGGFCNISFKTNNEIVAFDICPGNLPLNKLAQVKGLNYDKNGDLAKTGEINFYLLDLLNDLKFYEKTNPKSLGTEWLEEQFYPCLKFDKEIENNLRTVVEHIAYQIYSVLKSNAISSVLVSGGGTKNQFLIDRIRHYFKGDVIIPSEDIIDFKEAIIFAYLGVLYLEGKPNNVPSVTGASKSVVGGVLHLP
ncbi:MAG: anhydro-N-acetylmuramic acid kinase [Bacteroidota bacterium]